MKVDKQETVSLIVTRFSLVPRPLPDFISLLWCFLHNYEIKSGSGLGTRLTRVIMKYEGTEIDHKDYAFTMCGKHNWPPSQAFISRNRGRVSLVTSMVNLVQHVVPIRLQNDHMYW